MRFFTACAACIACGIASDALAGNRDSFFMGNRAAITGGAMTAVARDVESIWYNPAGLGASRRNSVDMSVTAYAMSIRDVDDIVRVELGSQTGALDLTSVDIITNPSAFGVVWALGDDWALGLGGFSPYNDSFSLRESAEVEATIDLPLDDGSTIPADIRFRQHVAFDGSATAYFGGPAIGWQPVPEFRFGAALFAVYAADSSWSLTWLESAAEVPGILSEAVVLAAGIEASKAFGLQVVTGIQWEPIDELAIGLVFRSPVFQVLEFEDSTSASVDGSQDPTETTISANFSESTPSDGGFDVVERWRLHVALAWQGEWGFLATEFDLQPEMSFAPQVEDEVTTWNVRVGGLFEVVPDVAVGFGLFTDRSPEPKPETSDDSRSDFYGFTLGAEWSNIHLIRGEDPETPTLVLSTSIAFRYALGVTELVGSTYNLGADTTAPRKVDALYHELGITLGSAFAF